MRHLVPVLALIGLLVMGFENRNVQFREWQQHPKYATLENYLAEKPALYAQIDREPTEPCDWKKTPQMIACWRQSFVFMDAVRAGFHEADIVGVVAGAPSRDWEEMGLVPQQRSIENEESVDHFLDLSNYKFHRKPVEVTGEDIESLKRIFQDQNSFSAWEGPKLCGKFYPAYAVIFRVRGIWQHALICFKCHEIIIDTQRNMLTIDIQGSAYYQLNRILEKYRHNASSRTRSLEQEAVPSTQSPSR